MQERKRQEDKRKAREDEIEKKRLHEEHQRHVQKFFADQQMELRHKLESMQDADKKKQDAILERQRRQTEENNRKRTAAEERLKRNFEMAKLAEEKRKQDFLSAQEKFENSRAIHLANQERERELHAQEVLYKKEYKIFCDLNLLNKYITGDVARAKAKNVINSIS
jgi:hypothetical protein